MHLTKNALIWSIYNLFQRRKRKMKRNIISLSITTIIITALAVPLTNVYLKRKRNNNSADSVIFVNTVKNKLAEKKLKSDVTQSDGKGDVIEPKVEDEHPKRPHIILIVADDLGYNDVGYHGSDIRTPNIDRLALAGVRLENYYVQPVCTPTRSQLLTGRYQIHTGLQHGIIWPNEPFGLPLDSPTLADKLKESGYATHIVGKWHLGFFKKEYMPTYRGFDSFFGFLTGHMDYFTHIALHQKYHGYDLREDLEPADVNKYNGRYSTHMFTERVVDILQKHNKTQPLFLYVPFQAPHSPMQVPDNYIRQKYMGKTKRRIYAGMVACLDEAVGNITKALIVEGLLDNSLIVFTTDNGAERGGFGSNAPLRGYKSQYFEGGIRAVGFMYSKWLHEKMMGAISTELIHVTDLFPTLVNLAKGDIDITLDGYDQWDTIIKRTPNKRSEILINIDPLSITGKRLFNNSFDTRIKAAIRMNDWKLITGYPAQGPRSRHWSETFRKGAENVWLFNVQQDPYETLDVSDKYPNVVQTMLDRLQHYHKTSVPTINQPSDVNADPNLHGKFWGPWL
ncbi:arylsulfatase J-like [Ruditapes philippinarum]|uniref:arylsulfatase J-like n=1 Tax=Ruditapes philippinarum TaxID=129788 RepID=UPI00295AF809|nr:arylsulfatase J-like [Ruditapes philippinarum]